MSCFFPKRTAAFSAAYTSVFCIYPHSFLAFSLCVLILSHFTLFLSAFLHRHSVKYFCITPFYSSALPSRLLSQTPSKSISPKIFPFPHHPQGFQHRTHSFPLLPRSLYSIFTSHCAVFTSIFCAIFLLYLSPSPPLLQLVFALFSFV